MATHRCSHAQRTTALLQCDLSRNSDETSLYTAHLSISICAKCGRIVQWHCQAPTAVCAWLESTPAPKASDL
jgi:hypothetical protein